jgi:hypothetical protein
MKAYYASRQFTEDWYPSKEAKSLGIPFKKPASEMLSPVTSPYSVAHKFGVFYVPPIGQAHTVAYTAA